MFCTGAAVAIVGPVTPTPWVSEADVTQFCGLSCTGFVPCCIAAVRVDATNHLLANRIVATGRAVGVAAIAVVSAAAARLFALHYLFRGDLAVTVQIAPAGAGRVAFAGVVDTVTVVVTTTNTHGDIWTHTQMGEGHPTTPVGETAVGDGAGLAIWHHHTAFNFA